MESQDYWRNRFIACTKFEDAHGYLTREVLNFKAAGGTEAEADAIIGSLMEQYVDDNKLLNLLESVGCLIVGYGVHHLFDPDFKEEQYYRVLPKTFDEKEPK